MQIELSPDDLALLDAAVRALHEKIAAMAARINQQIEAQRNNNNESPQDEPR